MVKLSKNELQTRFSSLFKGCGYCRVVSGLFGIIGILSLVGCAGANYGGLKRSPDVTQAFESYRVYPQHRYYHLYLESNPHAAVALDNRYTIADNQWTEFDPQTDKLKKIVDLIEAFPPVGYYGAYGSRLMDASGNQIGYWYSSLQMASIRVDNETKKVSIHTETPWLRDEERGFGTGVGVGIGSGGGGIGIRLGR